MRKQVGAGWRTLRESNDFLYHRTLVPNLRIECSSGDGWKRQRHRGGQYGRVSEAAPHHFEGSTQELEAETLGKRELVEAILFVTREPVSARKLATLAELDDPTEARTIARQLNELYDADQFAFRIEEVAGGMQILTRPQFAPWLRRLELVPAETVLSASMLETLAIIAYRQPVPRAEIEAIRGVGSDEALRQLMQRNLIRIEGRSEDLGRAYLYGTTKQFLQLFGLQSLDFLPRAQKIREAEAEIATRISIHPVMSQPTVPQAHAAIPHTTMSTSSPEVDAEPRLGAEEKIVP